MAKGGKGGAYKLPGLRAALRVVDQLGSQMHGESMADYKVAMSASKAGQANLSQQTRALTRDLLVGQMKNTTSLSKLARQGRAQTKKVAAEKAKVTSKYGSALGEQVAASYKPAATAASGTGKVMTGMAKAGKSTMKTAQVVAGIAQAGVAAQASAAKYGLAQALQQRNIIDNQTLANMTSQLYQQGLQYNAQLAMYERQREDARKDAMKAELGQTKDTLEFLNNASPEIGSWLSTYLDTHGTDMSADEGSVYGEDGKLDIALVREAYAKSLGIDLSQPLDPASQDATRLNVLTAIAREMGNGLDVNAATEAGLNTLYSGMQGWEKLSGSTLASITSGIGAEQERQALSNLATVGEVTVSGGMSINGYSLDVTESRDAAVTEIISQFGESTAKAWLRGQVGWSNDAIDVYMSTLGAGVQPDYNVSMGG